MKSSILLDTNILVDYMIPDRQGHDVARRLIGMSRRGDVTLAVFPGSLKDAYYICRKFAPEPTTRELIRQFLVMFDVLPFGQAECTEAAYSDEPDYEDGLVRAAAEHNGVDFIITRDRDAFQRSSVKSMDGETYLRLFGE